MIAIKPTVMRDQFKALCDKVVSGETIIITRPKNGNVVILSEKHYNEMLKTARNTDYLNMIDKSIAELESGKVIVKTLDELRQMEL